MAQEFGKSTSGYFFFLPLVYFNAAKLAIISASEAEKNFSKARSWFDKKLREINEYVANNRGRAVSQEDLDFMYQWPDGMGLDIEGAASYVHAPLAEAIAQYSQFFINGVAAVEAYINIRLMIMRHEGTLNDAES